MISPLDPESIDFERVLRDVPGKGLIARAIQDGRLRVLTSIGDYGVNLCRQGASGFLRELDTLVNAPQAVIVIDQADDLFTPHDPVATPQQASAYQRWAGEQGHTLVMLFLRVTMVQPLLGGNQAALTYLDGLADAAMGAEGLVIQAEFWDGDSQPASAETLQALGAWPPTAGGGSGAPSPALHAGRPTPRPLAWYVGPKDVALKDYSDQVDWELVDNLQALFGTRTQVRDAVVVLDRSTEFDEFLHQLQALRAQLGPDVKLILRESGFCLREYPQRLMLMAAGADAIISRDETLDSVVQLLRRAKTDTPSQADEPGPTANGEAIETLIWLQHARGGRLPLSRFIEEVEIMLEYSRRWDIPCTLAEIPYAAEVSQGVLPMPDPATRPGDLSTSASGSQLFFLQGCRQRDAVRVVERLLEDGEPLHVPKEMSLYGGPLRVRSRLRMLGAETLGEVRRQTGAAQMWPAPDAPVAARYRSVALIAASLLLPLLLASPTPSHAQSTPTTTTTAASVALPTFDAAFEGGRYTQAASLGLAELQQRPDDHELRMKVGNSLAWTGQYALANEQYRRLLATAFAADANVGLGNVQLWNGRPHAALARYRAALATNPDHAGAKEAQARALQAGRPKTTLRASQLTDSSETRRSVVRAAHRWADADLLKVLEVRAETGSEARLPTHPSASIAEVGFNFEDLGLPLAPRFDLSIQNGPKTRIFGEGIIRFADEALALRIGRVNWGHQVFDPRARQDGLTADVVGATGQLASALGQLNGSASSYRVSDGNRISEAGLRFTPALQPLPSGAGIRLFGGLSARNAQRVDPRYWSPMHYGTAELGASLYREVGALQVSGELKRSFRIGGDAADGWSIGANLAYRLNDNLTLRGDAGHLQTQRDGRSYKARNFHIGLQHNW